MQSISLFLAIDGLGRLEPSSLPEQTLMELLVENLSKRGKRKFQTSDGAFRDIREWPDVQLNPSGKVVHIRLWHISANGDLSLRHIPRQVTLFSSSSNGWTGTAEFADLPPAMERLELDDNKLHGTIETAQLPSTLSTCNLRGNKISGTVNLRTLPENMRDLRLSQNQLVGTVDLTKLGCMTILDLSSNQLTGSLDVSNLPLCMRQLLLSNNQFAGEICLENIPELMETLIIAKNQLTGPIRFVSTSKKLQILSLAGNQLSGEAVVSVQTGRVDLNSNFFSKVIDESGKRANRFNVFW